MIVAAGWAALKVRAHKRHLSVSGDPGQFELDVRVEHLEALLAAELRTARFAPKGKDGHEVHIPGLDPVYGTGPTPAARSRSGLGRRSWPCWHPPCGRSKLGRRQLRGLDQWGGWRVMRH